MVGLEVSGAIEAQNLRAKEFEAASHRVTLLERARDPAIYGFVSGFSVAVIECSDYIWDRSLLNNL